MKYQRAEWKKNELWHSFISYRLAEVQDAAKISLEAGNSPQIIFQHYRELVRLKEVKEWFGIESKSQGKVMILKMAELKAVAA